MRIAFATPGSDLEGLTDLFCGSLNPQYISHSELQGPRAASPSEWSSNIREIIRSEIADRLRSGTIPKTGDWSGVVEALEGDRLIGIALVSVQRGVRTFGTIEDVVVSPAERGRGCGSTLIEWILDQFSQAEIARAFLESGIQNESSHKLFHKLGFSTVSIVMMRELNGREDGSVSKSASSD